jgi:hypothetical protein
MLRFINDGVTTIKPRHQAGGNMCMIWSDESFMLFLTSLHKEEFTFAGHPMKLTI